MVPPRSPLANRDWSPPEGVAPGSVDRRGSSQRISGQQRINVAQRVFGQGGEVALGESRRVAGCRLRVRRHSSRDVSESDEDPHADVGSDYRNRNPIDTSML